MKRTWLVATLSLMTVIDLPTNHRVGAVTFNYAIVDLGTLGNFSVPYLYAINEAGQVTGQSGVFSPDATAQNFAHAFLYSAGAMIDLGTLGGVNSFGLAINAAGQVTGSAETSAGDNHAFLYSRGAMIDLGTLGGSFSEGLAINDASQVAGNSSPAGTVSVHAFLYSNGVMTDLRTFGGTSSQATAINAAGQVTGWAQTAGGDNHAFFYSRGVLKDLGTLGGSSSQGWAINDRGEVTGIAETSAGDSHAFLWTQGVMKDIGIPGHVSIGLAINEQGEVAGYGQFPGTSDRAFLYSGGVMKDLGAAGETYSYGSDINSSGQVIGYAFSSGDAPDQGILFDGSVTSNLNTLVPSGSGWTLGRALAINDKGQIAGDGEINGERHAYLLTPLVRVPRTKDDCKQGGWANLARANGTAFKNQGDCVSYVNTGK